MNCEIFFFFVNLYYSLVPISFIKGVDLIGTESKALWSLCLLHLSVRLCQSVQLPLHLTHPLDCSVCQISLQFSWQLMENTAPCQVWKLKDKFRAHRAETGRTDKKKFTLPLFQLKMNVRIDGGYLHDVVLFGDVGGK